MRFPDTRHSISPARQVAFSGLLLVVTLVVSLLAAEAFLRIKNSAMTNYDIEMWRYANELKQKSDDPQIDFDHRRSQSALLQSTEIRLNSFGLRGPEIAPLQKDQRRILFLGGSITLGWGVAENDTLEARLERMLNDGGDAAQVLNGGVGNYNAERYVSRFFKELMPLKPTDIVVHYFLRDAEELPPGGGNIRSPITVCLTNMARPRWSSIIGASTILRLPVSWSCKPSCVSLPSMRGRTTSGSISP
jgi:hypothetical protein